MFRQGPGVPDGGSEHPAPQEEHRLRGTHEAGQGVVRGRGPPQEEQWGRRPQAPLAEDALLHGQHEVLPLPTGLRHEGTGQFQSRCRGRLFANITCERHLVNRANVF